MRSRRETVGADDDPPVAIPIDGTLDLHTFDPREAADVVREYIGACRARGILELRIVHGKGRGVMRRRVQHLLERLPEVLEFRDGGPGGGDWGATLVTLRPVHGGERT